MSLSSRGRERKGNGVDGGAMSERVSLGSGGGGGVFVRRSRVEQVDPILQHTRRACVTGVRKPLLLFTTR